MGFPPQLWFDDAASDSMLTAPAKGGDVATRVGHLFDVIRHLGTGEAYTDAEVARMSAGVLTEEDAEGIRIGAIPDPTVRQVVALAAVFGVRTSYLVDRSTNQSVLGEEASALQADETTNAILRDSSYPPEKEKGIVLGIVREFGEAPGGG